MPGLISKKISFIGLLVIGTLVLAFVLLSRATPTPPDGSRTIWFKDTPITIEVVNTEADRERGLGGRTSLPPNHGMFFVFNHDDRHSFWMKDMRFAIDILWLDQNLVVVDIKRDATPESYPASFPSGAPARYVLELPAGFSRDYGIAVGDRLHF